MIAEGAGEALFEDLSVGFLKDLTGLAFPGSHTAMALAPHAARALHRALKKYDIADIPALLDSLVRLPFARAFGIAAQRAGEVELDEDLKWAAVKYLSAVPMTSRQALHRFDDGGHVTTMVSQVPQTVEQMARLMPARPPRFQPGDKLAGYDYRLELLLGQGGFAEVWKASHTERAGQPPVALKFCLDKALLPSLRDEIQAVDRLQAHAKGKDIVALKGTAYSADPPFLIYEYIDGGNLSGWLDSFGGAAPSAQDVISILKMTARAVAVAHGHGIVHRDLKPANLLITREGRVKVGDFGISAVVAQGATAPAAGLSAHTPGYSDPRRDPAAAPHPRDDVYAIGVIGYQLLAGSDSSPMVGAWQQFLKSRGVPGALVEVLETCVAVPEERYTDAGALLAALETLRGPAGAKSAKRKAKPKPEARPEPKPKPESKPKAAVKFCHSCGTRAPADRRFCTNCGYCFPA